MKVNWAQNTESSMPMFEYECRVCGRRFEHLTRADRDRRLPGRARRRPAEATVDVRRQRQRLGVAAPTDVPRRRTVRLVRRPAGPGACSMN